MALIELHGPIWPYQDPKYRYPVPRGTLDTGSRYLPGYPRYRVLVPPWVP